MRTFTVTNQKGGAGKTTTALAVGSGLILRGYRTLFVDLDPSGNLSYVLRANTAGYNAFGILQRPETAKEEIQHTEQGDIIASSPALAGADTQITQTGKEYRLREALETIAEDYDFCIIDTPPTLGILTVNALTACNGAIIPAEAVGFSLQGISQLHATIETVRKYCNPELSIMGIVLTRYNNRTIIRREVAEILEETAEELGTKLYSTRIRECTAIAEAQIERKSIYGYAPRSNASADYHSLVEEILGEEK